MERGLRFDGDESFRTVLDQQIDLVATRRPPEPEPRPCAGIEQSLPHLRDHEVLPHGAPHRVCLQISERAEPEQVAEQSGVGEIDLGRFDQTLRALAMIRLEQKHLMARFKDGQPSLRRVRRNADVAREIGIRKELTGAQGRRPHEAIEVSQIADVQYLSNVSLQVCGHVAA